MKKLIFAEVPMKNLDEKNLLDYSKKGNLNISCDKKVYFGFNAFLSDKIKDGDEIKIILVRSLTHNQEKDSNSLNNIEKFKKEFNELCGTKCASVKWEIIESDFSETKDNNEKRFRAMLSKLENNCEIFADVTFGPRIIMMISMMVLNFAEKFFDADIKNIIYSKVLFNKNNEPIPESAELFDITSLYYLNNLTNSMEAPNGEIALKALDEFFDL